LISIKNRSHRSVTEIADGLMAAGRPVSPSPVIRALVAQPRPGLPIFCIAPLNELYCVSVMLARRFPPPWSVEELPACFVVPHCGQVLAYVRLYTFHTKPILFNRALRLADILFFSLRCTEIQYPSLKFPSRCWIGTQQCPSRHLNFNRAAKPRSQIKSRQFQTKPILSRRLLRSTDKSSLR
jgi:hypothetical protein